VGWGLNTSSVFDLASIGEKARITFFSGSMGRPKKLFPVFRMVGANNPVCKKIPKLKNYSIISIKKPPFLREAILLQKLTTPESSSFLAIFTPDEILQSQRNKKTDNSTYNG
jgi:hypothetical protein